MSRVKLLLALFVSFISFVGIRSHTRPGGLMALSVREREVVVSVNHVSIEADQIERALQANSQESFSRADHIRQLPQYAGRKVIVSVDVCQRLSGGVLKMAAFEKLLTDYPNVIGKVVLIQKSIRTGNLSKYKRKLSNVFSQ